MKVETIKIPNTNATLDTYILGDGEYRRKGIKRPSVMICPGGGYSFVSQAESEPVALFFNRHGYNAFVLKYNTGIKNPFPTQVKELACAMALVKSRQEEYLMDGDVTVVGFSAGGHLALSLGCFYNKPLLTTELGFSVQEVQPTRLVLVYPAVTMISKATGEIPKELIEMMEKGLSPKFGPESIIEVLAGHTGVSDEEADYFNLLNHLHEDMPPTFVWGTYADSLIHASDITGLATELYKLKVVCEAHLFSFGEHGLSLADETTVSKEEIGDTSANLWTELCLKWLTQCKVRGK